MKNIDVNEKFNSFVQLVSELSNCAIPPKRVSSKNKHSNVWFDDELRKMGDDINFISNLCGILGNADLRK